MTAGRQRCLLGTGRLALVPRPATFSGNLQLVFVVLAATLGCKGNTTGPTGGGEVRERWYQAQTGYGKARPAIAGDLVYFSTGDGRVIARDLNTGTARWSTRVGGTRIEGYRLIARSGVVVAPIVHQTVGLDAQTGAVLWRYEAPKDTVGNGTDPGEVGASRPDVDDATLYIPAWGASVSAVNLRTGDVRWVWQPGKMEGDTAASGIFRSGSMGVTVSGDTIFATVWHNTNRFGGTSDAWVVALNGLAGTEFWRVRLPYQGSGVLVEAPPVLYRNLVIVHTLSARTFAIDRVSRQVVWEFSRPNAMSTIAGPDLHGETVYVDGGDDNMYALRGQDGSVIWRSPFPTSATRDLLVTARRVIFTNGGTLFVLDRQTGTRVATVPQPKTHDSFFASAAAYADGSVFVTVGDGAWAFEEP